MALTLDPTLATAQDSQSRKPLVELISSGLVADIPFDGVALTETNEESGQSVITHSSGRLIIPHIYSDRYLEYVYTDIGRTEFTTVQIDMGSGSVLRSIAVTELTDGNVGILILHANGATAYLSYKTFTPTGTVVNSGAISNWSASIWTTEISVITLANNTYLAVYGKFNTPNYELEKITSSDFLSWSSVSVISISGLDTTKKKYNPSLLQITTGDIFLWVDYLETVGPNGEELTNLYYSISADNGTSWAAAVKITNYDDYTEIGKHPIAIQQAADSMTVVFYEQRGSLWMPEESLGVTGIDQSISGIHFDSVDRKVYGYVTYVAAGNKIFISAFQIDVDTWSVDKVWDTGTTPAFNTIYANEHVWYGRWEGDSDHVLIGVKGSSDGFFAILDAGLDTITQLNFANNAPYLLDQNVSGKSDPWSGDCYGGQLDADTNRAWFLWESGILSSTSTYIGYVDYSGAGPDYTFTEIHTFSLHTAGLPWQNWGTTDWRVYPAIDMGFQASGFAGYGLFRSFLLSEDASVEIYDKTTYPDLPLNPIGSFVYDGGYIWGVFAYSSLPAEAHKRGLCRLDITTNTFVYLRPSWATLDEYAFEIVTALGDGRIMISGAYGVTIYNPSSDTWILYDNDSVPGLTPDVSDDFDFLAYDSTNDMIFGSTSIGLAGFLEVGFVKQAHYLTGTYITSWSFGASSDFVLGYRDYDAVVTLDPDNGSIYAFWTTDIVAGSHLKWDNDSGTVDLSSYLLNDTEISVTWTIENQPSSLTFSVSKGHLFDNTNINSLFRTYLEKGRKLSLRFGEKISDVDYWADQGEYVVTENRISYSRGRYPSMDVRAESRDLFWDQNQVVATPYYEVVPDAAIEDVLTTFANVEAGDINLPVFDDGFSIETQWLDTYVSDIVNELSERFKYFTFYGMDGKVTSRKISTTNPTDHAYPDNSKLFEFTPDDTFSSFINRVIVTGQERDFIEVLFAEERVASMQGTVGWWGADKDHIHWYSDDQSRRCRYPRLEVIETATSIGFKLVGAITESISYVDPEDKYCIVEIDVPSLIPILIAGLALYMLGNKIPDIPVVYGFGASTGHTIPIGRWAESTGLFLVLQVLASVGSYQYDIHAQPIGQVRRSIQAQADDLELQNKVGVIENKIEGFLCYTIASCKSVADFMLLMEQLQRSRLKFTKIAHLQDEVGDTITHPHPYSGTTLKFLVNRLTRRYKTSSKETGNGYFTDDIEGWRL